jgi:hypothetical protein
LRRYRRVNQLGRYDAKRNPEYARRGRVTQKLMEIVTCVIIGNYHELSAASGTSAQQLGDFGTDHCRLPETCISIQA